MKRRSIVLILLLLVLLPAVPASAAAYDRIIGEGDVVDEDINVFRNDLLIEAGGLVNGKVTVFNGDVRVDGSINGDLSVFDGDVVVNGFVIGNLVIFGGNLELAPDARVDGDCFVGGEITDESNAASCAQVGSRFLENMPIPPVAPARPASPVDPALPELPSAEVPRRAVSPVSSFVANLSEAVGRSLLMGILALVVTAVFPRQLQQVGKTVRERPAASGAVGFLTAVAVPSLLVILLVVLAITIIGFLLYPAVFLLALVPLAALMLGWIAVGERFGNWLMNAFKQTSRSLVTTAALGTSILTLGLGLLTLVPPFSIGGGFGIWLAGMILASVGLGAAVLTKLGTQPYPPGSGAQGKVGEVLETLPKSDDVL
jgi:cytoskeletal protein CcmA (bactofilin family)